MTDYREDFFDEVRPWSRLKNSVLGSYMPPYLAKVAKRPQRIVLIDAFAGPGRFSDGNDASPLLIGKAAERYAQGRYIAYFLNLDEAHHKQLSQTFSRKGWSSCKAVYGDAVQRLEEIIALLDDETLFLYIDPFGLDCEFELLRPLLQRNRNHSTEILINLSMPITHRLAARNRSLEQRDIGTQIDANHSKLTRAYGGDYWRDALFGAGSAKARESKLVEGYCARLGAGEYLNYSGACPVREKSESATKYYMVFASPHEDAILLMNDNMCRSFNRFMHEHWVKDTLFADDPWQTWRDKTKLQEIVLAYLNSHPNLSRLELWKKIVIDHFMLFADSEYRQAVNSLFRAGRIDCVTPVKKDGIRPSAKLNDHCVLRVSDNRVLL